MKWGGRRAQAWTRAVLARKGRVCALALPGCTRIATEADHIVPFAVDPSRAYDPDNGRPSCRHCNATRGDGRPRGVTVDERAFFESGSATGRTSGQSPPRASGKSSEPGLRIRFSGGTVEP